MVSDECLPVLWNTIEASRSLPEDDVKFAAANAATLLTLKAYSFDDLDLSFLQLRSVNLPTKIHRANFTSSNLRDVYLGHRDLRGSNLTDALLDAGSLVGADLRGCPNLGPHLAIYTTSGPDTTSGAQNTEIAEKLQGFLEADSRVCWLAGPQNSGKTSSLTSLMSALSASKRAKIFFSRGGMTKLEDIPRPNLSPTRVVERGYWYGVRHLRLYRELGTWALAGVSEELRRKSCNVLKTGQLAGLIRIYHGSAKYRDGAESLCESLQRVAGFLQLRTYTGSAFAACHVD